MLGKVLEFLLLGHQRAPFGTREDDGLRELRQRELAAQGSRSSGERRNTWDNFIGNTQLFQLADLFRSRSKDDWISRVHTRHVMSRIPCLNDDLENLTEIHAGGVKHLRIFVRPGNRLL